MLASATFMVFLSHSAITYLAAILRDLGVGEAGIGVVMSAPLVPMLAGMVLSGHLMERFGPLKIVRLGFLLILLAHLSLQFTISGFSGVYLSRSFHGLGYGIFMPAGMTYVKGKLRPEKMVYPFGIYSSSIILPNIVGPWIMENLYEASGLQGLFLLTAIPSLFGNVLAGLLRPEAPPERKEARMGYSRLLGMPHLRSLYIAIFTVGLVYGVIPTLMALYLRIWQVPMVCYFTPFTAALFAGRFAVIPFLGRLPRNIPVAAGFFLMGVSHLLLVAYRSPAAAVLSGIIIGLGYSMEYPSLSVWISGGFPAIERAKPVALLNLVFHAGIYITPLIGGWVTEMSGPAVYLGVLVILALGAAAALGKRWGQVLPSDLRTDLGDQDPKGRNRSEGRT
ncbi:MAG: MFS transporter [Proteobacteria bacterium]|nr:MFS transporter [Pseudomonadota bacterium]